MPFLVSECAAEISGAGVYASRSDVQAQNGVFRNNAATSYGGSLFLTGASSLLLHQEVTVDGSNAKRGGGVYATQASCLFLQDGVTFQNNFGV